MSRITFRLVHITPTQAAEWLKRNTRNRPICLPDVDRYRRDLERGNWITTHQGVAFALDGTLIDGQHRLTAIVEAGVGAEMPVFENLSLDAIAVIDDHRVRRIRDRVALIDRDVPTTNEVACIKAMVRSISKATVARRTQQEELAIFREHIGAARFAIGLLSAAGAQGTQRRAPVAAVIARASYSVPHEKLKQFCEVLVSGLVRPNHPEDSTIIVFRDFLASPAVLNSGGSMASTLLYRKSARALDAFVRGQVVSKLYESTSEPFPMPSRSEEAA